MSTLAAVDHADHEHGGIHPDALHDDAAPKSRGGVEQRRREDERSAQPPYFK